MQLCEKCFVFETSSSFGEATLNGSRKVANDTLNELLFHPLTTFILNTAREEAPSAGSWTRYEQLSVV